MIEIIGGTFAAGETKTFHINGEYFELLDAQYAVDVMLMDKSGAQLSVMRNSEASFFSRPREGFQTIQITSAQAQFVRAFIGSGDAGTRRISSTVQVIDGERARADAGVMFSGSAAINPGGGLVGVLQLWNPAGSGKRVIVGQAGVGAANATSLNAYFSVAALATDQTATRAANKKAGSGIGAAQVRVGTAASSAFASPFWSAFVQANGYLQWPIKGVILVPPGAGFGFVADTPAAIINSNFEWFEEAV